MTQFSFTYRSFTAWLHAKPRLSIYAKTIIRRHQIAPHASLQVLRTSGTSSVSNLAWNSLSANQREMRKRSLNVLHLIRQGKPFKTAAKEYGITPKITREQLGRAIIKRGGRWVGRKSDTIERGMRLYENGRITSITVTNSKDASLMGEYFSAVKKALRTRDPQPLQKFKHITITDANGTKHRFETNLKKLYEIEERQENSEFFDIYDE